MVLFENIVNADHQKYRDTNQDNGPFDVIIMREDMVKRKSYVGLEEFNNRCPYGHGDRHTGPTLDSHFCNGYIDGPERKRP